MDTKQLKQKILDLAIRGKLVPQDPNDEPASVLLERIRKEKEQLIASGKLKKTKSKTTDTPHYENVPFEIPDSWEWCQIANLGKIVTGTTPSKLVGEYYNGEYPFYKPTDLEQGINTLTSSDSLTLAGLEASRFLPKRSILVTCIGATIGKTGVIQREGSCNQQINAIIPYSYCNPSYIYYCIISGYIQNAIKSNASATTLPILNKSDFSNLLFPLPPFSEQQRIVQDIEKWFALIDDIEAHKSDLLDYIKQAKSKVLDLAIHGKLVPQDPNDEPAIDLLKRINPSFKPCDTSHYENLPSGWASVMLLDICKIDTGKWDANHASINGKYRFYTCSAQFSYSDTKRFSGECLIIPGNGDIGQVYYYDGDFDAYQRTYVLSHILIYSKYLYYHLLSNWRNVNTDKQFGSTIKFVRIGNFQNYIVLLPPLAEQKRIVERIETIFAQLDTITAEL